MKFLATLQHSNTEINWSYHFFPNYHGYSVCDTVASHAKKKVTNSMIDTGVAIRSSSQIIEEVGKLKNHVILQAVIAKGVFSISTLAGIRKYYKFTAHKQNDWIYAYSDSTQLYMKKDSYLEMF